MRETYIQKIVKNIAIGLIILLSACDTQARALSGIGAQVDKVNTGRSFQVEVKTIPGATINIIGKNEEIIASGIDMGGGIAKMSFRIPEANRDELYVFASDGFGLTERIRMDTGGNSFNALLPPTIYQNLEYGRYFDALGFIGMTFPNSTVKVFLASSINENRTVETVANGRGERQIGIQNLNPGKYQANAKAYFGNEESEWSQMMKFEVLQPSDRAVQDIGAGARGAIENVTGALPEPAQDVVNQVNEQAEFVSKVVVPAVLTMGTLAQMGLVLRNIFYLLLQLLIAVGQALGIIQKRRQWGVVYDSVTKRPLVRAIVRLYEWENRNLIETDVTAKSGVFSFMPKPGIYYLEAAKPGYIFPSQIVIGKSDGEYQHVYIGGEIRVGDKQGAIDVAVPLDPQEYKETRMIKWQRFYGRYLEPLNNYLLVIGAILAILAFARKSNTLNFGVLWMYIFGLGLQAYSSLKIKREWGSVLDAHGRPVVGVEVTLTDVEFNHLASRRVTDENGRYQFVAPPGRYMIRVVTPMVELIPRVKGSYAGEEFKIVGKEGAETLIVPKIVVRDNRK